MLENNRRKMSRKAFWILGILFFIALQCKVVALVLLYHRLPNAPHWFLFGAIFGLIGWVGLIIQSRRIRKNGKAS